MRNESSREIVPARLARLQDSCNFGWIYKEFEKTQRESFAPLQQELDDATTFAGEHLAYVVLVLQGHGLQRPKSTLETIMRKCDILETMQLVRRCASYDHRPFAPCQQGTNIGAAECCKATLPNFVL
jgi:hypothetical protein